MDIVLLCEQRMIFCSSVLLTWFLYPYFKIFILWELFFYFQRSVPFHRDRHTNEQARFVWSVWFYLFVTLDWHFPEYSLFLVLQSLSLIHICSVYLALGSCRVCIICPLEICCSFVVSLYVLCLGKFRTSWDKVVNCFLKLPTNSALSVSHIFQNPVSVVVGL